MEQVYRRRWPARIQAGTTRLDRGPRGAAALADPPGGTRAIDPCPPTLLADATGQHVPPTESGANRVMSLAPETVHATARWPAAGDACAHLRARPACAAANGIVHDAVIERACREPAMNGSDSRLVSQGGPATLLLAAWLGWTASASAGSGPPAAVHPGEWPQIRPAVVADSGTEAFVDRLLATMTLEEKVGQLVQADIASVTPEEVRQYHLGSILAGGNAAPGGDVRAPASRWLELADRFFRVSVAAPPPTHVAIPIVFGIDAVHGHARIPGATVFPHNVGLGAAHDAELIEQIGRVTAAEVSATGIDWTFAPTVAVVRDVRWGRSYESYSEDPALVATYARAMVTGLQGRPGTPEFLAAGHTLASVKHFVGDGGTFAGRDQFDSSSDERSLRDIDAAGYPAALSAGALIVMASYNSWHGVKMHANHSLLTDVLKGRWAFPGVVVGDWNAQEQIPGCTKYSCPEMIAAGVDMYMAPDSWKRLVTNLIEQARSGRVEGARLDDAVRRILRVKALAGLFGKRPPTERPEAASLTLLGSAGHRAVARQAVRESLVLLKNNAGLLPLDPHSLVLVTGPGADDIGMQCGGWTIDWQGAHNTNADFPGGTSVLAGIRAAVAAAGGGVTTNVDHLDAARPAAAIVVYGETPYAEFEGDRETLEFSAGRDAPIELLRRLRVAGIPTVSVFLSGRPLWVNRELNASDAFIAAWLPGSEGAGIADLLFRPPPGAAARDFTGRLSFSWPATAMPVTFDAHGAAHGALFPRGFGLSLGAPHETATVAEDPRVPAALRARDTLFHAGHVTAPWSIFVADRTAEVRLTTDHQRSPDGVVTAELAPPSVRASWAGVAVAEFRIGTRATDYRAAAHDNRALQVRYRVEQPPSGRVGVGVRCEAPYGTSAAVATSSEWQRCGTREGALLDVTSTFRAAPLFAWRTLVLPLECLERVGASLATVTAPFVVETAGRFAVSFDDIRLVHETVPTPCPAQGAWAATPPEPN